MTSAGDDAIQEHISQLLTSEWGVFDMLLAQAAYGRPIFLAALSEVDGKSCRPWILQSVNEFLSAFGGLLFAVPREPSGQRISLGQILHLLIFGVPMSFSLSSSTFKIDVNIITFQ